MIVPRWATWIRASVAAAVLIAAAGEIAVKRVIAAAPRSAATEIVYPPSAATAAASTVIDGVHADAGNAVGPWSEEWIDETWDDCCPPVWSHWTINLDAVFWRRNTPDDLQLAMSNPGVNPNASSLTFDHEAGPRLALIRRGISGWDVELNYVGIEGFQSNLTMPEAVDLRVPGDDPGGLYTSDRLGFAITGTQVRYDSRLHSEELNLRRQLNDTWTGLVGIRAVQVYENFHVDDSNLASFYSIRAENRLFGLQLGGEGKLFCTERFLLTTSFKAGLFENNSEQATTDFAGSLSNTALPVSLAASMNQASFVGEIGLLGTYRLSETILVRAGYNVMWIDDVSLASEQLVANEFQSSLPPPDTALRSVRTDGQLLYHGAVVGVELTW